MSAPGHERPDPKTEDSLRRVATTRVSAPYRIAVRIYVVTLAAVLAAAIALFFFALTTRHGRGPFGAVFIDFARYAAGQISAHGASGPELEREVEALSRSLRVPVAVHAWDGALLAAAGPALPPLSPDERAALVRGGMLERSGLPFPEPPQVAIAISPAGAPKGYVVMGTPPPPRPGATGPLLTVALVVAGVGLAALVLGSAIARPLDRLARTAQALGSGDLAARTGIARRDEIGIVARAFDEMAERMRVLLRGQTELIANVAHELRTPLARIRVALDLAAEGDAASARESLAEIAEDLSELEALVSDVLTSARMGLSGNTVPLGGPPLHRTTLDVSAVVTQAVERLRHRFPERHVELELGPDLPQVEADTVLLRRALDNLLDNARKYSPPESAIRVRAGRQGGGAVIEVADAGDGISPEDLERLFTPFFRADRSRARATGGVGLGLALTRRIVEAHGGTIVARSAPGAGTTMTVTLPARA